MSNGFQCAICHNLLSTYTRFEAAEVTFPSGATIDSGDPNMNLCMTCHKGRSSTNTVNATIGDKPPDTPDEDLGFINIHYFAAGATRYGTEVKGAYEYEGKEYAGFFEHVPAADGCTERHNAHQLVVQVDKCANCHEGISTVADLEIIPESDVEYDGDGDATEGLCNEVVTMRNALLVAIWEYFTITVGVSPITYNSHNYPYFFVDDGIGETRNNTWTPSLVQAA